MMHPFGRPTPGRPIGRPGVGQPQGVFGVFSYYLLLVMLFFNMVCLTVAFTEDMAKAEEAEKHREYVEQRFEMLLQRIAIMERIVDKQEELITKMDNCEEHISNIENKVEQECAKMGQNLVFEGLAKSTHTLRLTGAHPWPGLSAIPGMSTRRLNSNSINKLWPTVEGMGGLRTHGDRRLRGR
jgi:hypothetical protein